MNSANKFPDRAASTVPKLAWLEVTEIILNIASDLFALAQRFPRFTALPWAAIAMLRIALRALGHAPAHSYLEFRADLPVQI